MRNLNFLNTFVLLLLTCVLNPTLAQKVIVEKNISSESSPINYQSNFDKQNYNLFLNESGQKIYSLNNTTPIISEAGQMEDVTVTIETAQGSLPAYYAIIYNESGYFSVIWGNTITVPSGIYDIFLYFMDENERDRIVIKELIDIYEDTTIFANINEADRYISTNLYNENGELLEPGLYNPDTGDVVGGNSTITVDRTFFFNPVNNAISLYSNVWNMKFSEDEDPGYSFYVNGLSDRYSISQNAIGMGNEGKLYFNKYETLSEITENINILENSSEDYVYHKQDFTSSPLGVSGGVKLLAFTTMEVINDIPVFGLTFYHSNNVFNSEQKFEAFLNNPLDEDINNFLVFPAIIDYVATDDPFTGQGFYIVGNAVVKEGDQVFYGSRSATTNGYFLGDIPYYDLTLKALPFHPKFSFIDNEINIGNNTPISVTSFVENSLKVNYIGRYGERRDSDFFDTNVEVKQNNATVFSGNYLNSGFLDYLFPLTGTFQVTFSNTNSIVEELEGKNITELFFNENLEDSTPPTLQYLQFRNTDNEVTDRFGSAQEGVVQIAAGDFKLNIDDLGNYYYNYVEGNNVQFYYSTYNQDNWTELELTKYEEYFQMPAFGDYYEVSLAGIENNESNVWYDVKVICTDASGNKQEQTISPAFKINNTMSTDETTKSNFTVYPNPFSDNLNIQLPEDLKGNVIFRVTDLKGKTIYSKEGIDKFFTWNGSSLSKGIYILSIENNGKIIAKKVIKK